MKVFIMGMHRSGTSLVTGLLKMCGLHVGTNLLMHAKDNPKGHYEEKRFMNLNIQLLRRNGGSWHKPPRSIAYTGLRPAMIDFLNWDEWKRDHIGWKDPRICLTFPLWHELVRPEEIRIVYVDRKNEEIAKSLKKRNGFPMNKGIALAKYYKRNAYVNMKRDGVSRFVVYFDSFFNVGWFHPVIDLCVFCGIKPPFDMKPLENFISPALRHHRSGDRE